MGWTLLGDSTIERDLIRSVHVFALLTVLPDPRCIINNTKYYCLSTLIGTTEINYFSKIMYSNVKTCKRHDLLCNPYANVRT